jgi:hypothetical protein
MRSRSRKDGEALQQQQQQQQPSRPMVAPSPPASTTAIAATMPAEDGAVGRAPAAAYTCISPPRVESYDWSALQRDDEQAEEGGAEKATRATRATRATAAGELEALAIRDLKELITSAGLSTEGCLDRQDLLQRASEAMMAPGATPEGESRKQQREQQFTDGKGGEHEPFNPLAWLFSA